MADSTNDVHADAAALRKKRVVDALLNFDWGDYRLHDIQELANEVLADLEETGESDLMDWVNDLADAAIVAARPITLSELSESDGKV